MHKPGTLVRFSANGHKDHNPSVKARYGGSIGEVVKDHEGPCTPWSTILIFFHGPDMPTVASGWFCWRFDVIFEPKD